LSGRQPLSWVGLAWLAAASLGAEPAHRHERTAPAAEPGEIGFVMVAPDRGFLGNDETRDAFGAFAASRNAALVFVTDERTRGSADRALRSVTAAGARRVVVLPFFLSRWDPGYRRAESALAAATTSDVPVVWALPFGESYLAAEALAGRLRGIAEPAGRRIVVVGSGARDAESRERMTEDWRRLAGHAGEGLGFEAIRVVLETSNAETARSLAAAVEGGARPVVVPFHLGGKLDGMMSFSAFVRGAAPEPALVVEGDVTPDESVGLWLEREANRQRPPWDGDVGVVALAHGSDYHWNETMRQALAPLQERYALELAFSMADPVVIERAVRRLEARGARRIVILRIFALAASFREDVERLIGLDVESGAEAPRPRPGTHAHHGAHGGHGGGRPAPRIRAAALMTTVGGLEDHPLFAEALLERARGLSRDPARETVVLVAHGEGDDERDAYWRRTLESIAARMRGNGGDGFRAIKTATWREDWPEKRRPAVERVRALIQEASGDAGRALVLPARTLGQGPERRLLEGLAFELGEGFAPHPLFARWAQEQVSAALRQESVEVNGSRHGLPKPCSLARSPESGSVSPARYRDTLLAHSRRLLSIHATFSCTWRRWVSRSIVTWSPARSATGKTSRAVRATASWPSTSWRTMSFACGTLVSSLTEESVENWA
jgi:sirohydrochlorin ferrochelatase